MKPENKTSILESILLGLLPYTKENIDLVYNPRKFFRDLEKIATKNTISSTIYRAKQYGYLKEVELDNNKKSLQVTPKGKMKIYKLIGKENRAWDGKWRLIFFDIPEKQRHKRDFFRRKLKELGFKQYQLSAWICPFDFADEIDELIYEIGINKYVQYIIGESIKGEGDIKRLFNI
ncbi:hypothetical protein CO123_02305 [bacterium (Candidatus Howlettbacteria) CG_4_9_14_3_um_filter_37_10]|nr:MAG: hypothetical protein COX25_02845 [bacterium (Candidatus Howlettbacteria) CG23_combo_of_CG06-09_8_20_14_all_37_9]PJB06374.1 MAG: hypothetical protein CO123_02305 [bacterium (Candidatus Howlettbacteria) CG_4_9_14_3_um_filter_37_10]